MDPTTAQNMLGDTLLPPLPSDTAPQVRADLVAMATGKEPEEIEKLQAAATNNGELYPGSSIVKLTGDKDFDEMFSECIATLDSKGQEYTIGSKDRLANFKTVGANVDIPMEKVWFTYFYKHYSAIVSYLKNGCQVKSNEPIRGRIMDCIVYLVLFSKMVREIEAKREQTAEVLRQQELAGLKK